MKLLTVGNSFSDDSMEYVGRIARSVGVDMKLGNLYIGGCTLNTHCDNARADSAAYEYRTDSGEGWSTVFPHKMSDALLSEPWDVVSLQQASGSSGLPETYARLPELIAYVRGLVPETTRLVWNMTWAYQRDSEHEEFSKYGRNQDTMYEAILSAIQSEVRTKKEISLVIPTGTAIQNARTSFAGDTLTRDGYHLSFGLGRYIAGLTFVRALTSASLEGCFAPEGITEEEKKVAVESAVNAVKNPRSVTLSAYVGK